MKPFLALTIIFFFTPFLRECQVQNQLAPEKKIQCLVLSLTDTIRSINDNWPLFHRVLQVASHTEKKLHHASLGKDCTLAPRPLRKVFNITRPRGYQNFIIINLKMNKNSNHMQYAGFQQSLSPVALTNAEI